MISARLPKPASFPLKRAQDYRISFLTAGGRRAAVSSAVSHYELVRDGARHMTRACIDLCSTYVSALG